MSTQRYTLTDAWLLVATTAQEFLLENPTTSDVHVTFSAAAPAPTAAYHTLSGASGLVRAGVSGSVYARSSVGAGFIVVSTST